MTDLLTRPWEDIARVFRGDGRLSCQAIAGLCDYIIARPIRTGLHGWTSIHALVITQIPVSWPYDGPSLEIEPQSGALVEFRYVDTHIRTRMWQRTEPPERVIERFRKTMIQLNWFTDPSTLD